MLSLIADRWLKKLLPRFRSRKLWISWMWSEMGFSRSRSSVCTRRRRRKTERKRRSVESSLWHAEFSFFFFKRFWSCDICPASAVSKLRTDTNFTGLLFSPLELGDLRSPSHLPVATNIPRFTGGDPSGLVRRTTSPVFTAHLSCVSARVHPGTRCFAGNLLPQQLTGCHVKHLLPRGRDKTVFLFTRGAEDDTDTATSRLAPSHGCLLLMLLC